MNQSSKEQKEIISSLAREQLRQKLFNLSLVLIIYTLLVILWGAWVRISHSGDGCGDTWPLCQGQVVPASNVGKTWVEYLHRFTSGIYGLFVFGLFFWIKKISKVTTYSEWFRWSRWVLIFMISEALLGAKLVLFGLVNTNDSVFRIVVMSLHQVNSFLLMLFTVRLWCSCWKEVPVLGLQSGSGMKLRYLLFVFPIIIAISGAWASLSTTLFPSISLLEGLKSDFMQDSHLILKIRILHPILALALGGFLSFNLYKLTSVFTAKAQKMILMSSALVVLTMVVGMMTLLTLSPKPLKIIHLLFAQITWVVLSCVFHFWNRSKDTTT